MFGWFQNRKRRDLFTRAFVKTARKKFTDGEISYDKLQECLKAAENKKGMERARKQLAVAPGLKGGIKDWDWEAILQWFKDYFIPALKIILPIALMLLEPNPTPDDE